MTAPMTVAQELVRRLGDRLEDPTQPLSEIELKRIEVEIDDAIKKMPSGDEGMLFNLKGLLGVRRNRFQDALGCFENAGRYDKKRAVFDVNRAAALLELGRDAEGEACLDAALKKIAHDDLAPADSALVLWLNTSSVRWRRGNLTEAQSAFEQAEGLASASNAAHQFRLAIHAAVIDRPGDAAEYAGRSLALLTGEAFEEVPAADFIRQHEDLWRPLVIDRPKLANALEAALRLDTAPESDDHWSTGPIVLAPDAWNRVLSLINDSSGQSADER